MCQSRRYLSRARAPLLGLLGLAADVRTTPTADNQAGAVTGESISAAGNPSNTGYLVGHGCLCSPRKRHREAGSHSSLSILVAKEGVLK
jgi:hypothetical protein